jgi:hypothetical protein
MIVATSRLDAPFLAAIMPVLAVPFFLVVVNAVKADGDGDEQRVVLPGCDL